LHLRPRRQGTQTVEIVKIISGGQAGADRAALDWAIEHGVAHGGWCPRGRKAEDGTILSKYRLTETASASYRARTRMNVSGADATLIFNMDELDGGSLETLRIAERLAKPTRVVQVDSPSIASEIATMRAWLREMHAATLNVAGPRESKRPGIYAATLDAMDRAFARTALRAISARA
jgi:hypothetical protein